MFITLDIFSGRPNPTWQISPKEVQQLVKRVHGKSLHSPDSVEPTLGYRGLVLSSVGDERLAEGMPSSFRIDGPLPAGFRAVTTGLPHLAADEADDIARWLIETGKHEVNKELLSYVAESRSLRALGKEPHASSEPPAKVAELKHESEKGDKAPCIIASTAYNPAFWNQPGVQPKNNCYNYAMNYCSNTFAQPGRISGHPNNIMQCLNVATAANWDGCKATCSGSNKLVALVIWPGQDYHWYRKHSEGFWGHKPGSTAARNTDSAGKLIDGVKLTPQNCNRGPYTIFCGYRYSPTGMKVS